MPKLDEFEVHTMGGGASSGNASLSSSSDLGVSQNISAGARPSGFQPQTMQSPSSPSLSSQPASSPLGGMGQGGPSKPFTGAPVSGGGLGSGIGGANVQTMVMEDELSGKSSSKLLKIFIGVFVGIILVGGAIFGVYFLKDKDFIKQYFPDDSTEETVEKNLGINDQIVFPTSEVKEEIEQPEPVKTIKMRYSNELLNYLSIDTESETILSDIQNELNIIRLNLPSHNFSEPITFIVTNKQNKPISFSDFTVYSDMGISSDILLALDDRFEIYAYNDFSAGVRFGFRVDVKNAEALNKALDANAAMIPPATLIFFKNFTINPDLELKFNNGSYENYTVKYINLNETQTSSVDYIVDEDRWVLGTSQKTLRAIIDKLDKVVSSEESESDVTTVEDSGVTDSESSSTKNSSTQASSSSSSISTTQSNTGTAN